MLVMLVVDQVSVLFKDHPDLLRDFTYFLPDAVQPQAEERLRRSVQRAQRGSGSGAAAGKRGGAAPGQPAAVKKAGKAGAEDGGAVAGTGTHCVYLLCGRTDWHFCDGCWHNRAI